MSAQQHEFRDYCIELFASLVSHAGIAGLAAKPPGYRIFLSGNPTVMDGTSAVAPLWAALIARVNALRQAPVGLINPELYGDANLFRAITQGDNRVSGKGYDAGPGWNACTGLGVPKGESILATLTA